MAGWYMTRRPNMSSKVVIALALLAFALVAAVPVALLVGVLMMLLGHVIGGLALFGGSILAATAAVVLAGITGVRHLRGRVRPAWSPSATRVFSWAGTTTPTSAESLEVPRSPSKSLEVPQTSKTSKAPRAARHRFVGGVG